MNDAQAGQWAPDFTLPEETVQALLAFADRHGIENVSGFVGDVGRACQAFLAVRERARCPRMERVEIDAIDARLWRVRRRTGAMLKHAEALALLLEQEEIARRVRFDSMRRPYRSRFPHGGEEFLRDLCDNLKVLADATGAYRQPVKRGPGRPPGKSEHGRVLAVALCECLAEQGIRVRVNGKGTGVVHQLLDLLRGPLDIGAADFKKQVNEVVAGGLFNVAADIWRE